MQRVCGKALGALVQRRVVGSLILCPTQPCRCYTSAGKSGSSAVKIVCGSLVVLGGGIGGTMLYASWDPKFRANVEKSVPYSDKLFEMALGPSTYFAPMPKKPYESRFEAPKAVKPKLKEKPKAVEQLSDTPKQEPQGLGEASTEAAHIISAISEVPSVPAPGILPDTELPPEAPPPAPEGGECTKCVHEAAVKERQPSEVAARLASQDLAEKDLLTSFSDKLEETLGRTAKFTLQAIMAHESAFQAIDAHTKKLKEAMDDGAIPADQKSSKWRSVEEAEKERTRMSDNAAATLEKARGELSRLKTMIEEAKKSNITGARAQIIAAEENMHKMVVDLDQMVNKVNTAQTEAKVMSQYSELVEEAKNQFHKELDSITPEVQTGWKGLTLAEIAGKLTPDDLNALIAHAHRRIDHLNRELAEQRVREQVRVEAALEQQRLEDKMALDGAVAAALERHREEIHLQEEKKVEEVRDVMEAEMRTQLRRQAAAHTDHMRDVLRVQEVELKAEAQQNLNKKMVEKEMQHRRESQEQLDQYTLDLNSAYARLRGMEDAIESHAVAAEKARKAHQLWLSIEALNYSLKTSVLAAPTEPLEAAAAAVRDCCYENEFAQALAAALPAESLERGVYSEGALRARFYAVRRMARRVALVDETRNSLYQYFLSYLQSLLLFEPKQLAPPTMISPDDLDTFRVLAYATYCIEHGDLELAAKFVNQLRGESRRVAQDWLTEVRLTLETRQIASLLSAYANAVGLGTTQAPHD